MPRGLKWPQPRLCGMFVSISARSRSGHLRPSSRDLSLKPKPSIYRWPNGRFLLSILGALASMEREIVVKRTQAGLLAAATLGPRDSRPPSMDQARIRVAKAMLAQAR
jgi:hypothetical protein